MEQLLALEMVRVTEAAAIESARFMGRGAREEADQAATTAMRKTMDEIEFAGRIVIGEGERDEAPMLYIGEKVGTGAELVRAGGLVEQLRAVKDPEEVAAMRAAAELAVPITLVGQPAARPVHRCEGEGGRGAARDPGAPAGAARRRGAAGGGRDRRRRDRVRPRRRRVARGLTSGHTPSLRLTRPHSTTDVAQAARDLSGLAFPPSTMMLIA